MFTAIKLFLTGLPLKNIAIGAIGILLITNLLTAVFLYKAKADVNFWKGEYKGVLIGIETATTLRKEQNKEKERKTKEAKEKDDAEHKKQLEILKVHTQEDRNKLKSELEKERENIKLFTYKLNAAYDKLRIKDSSIGTPRSETSCEARYTETSQILNGIVTYGAALERNCAVTTADFNRASQWIESVCDVHGCGE